MFKLLLKGIVIGLANIVPGVSGGTLMVSMNVYDDIIHALSHFFSQFKRSLKILIPVFIGMGIAIIGASFGLKYLFNSYPLQTYLLFIGLILGGIPAMFAHVKGRKINVGHIMSFALFFLAVVGLAYLGGGEGTAPDLSLSLVNVLKLFGVGIIASATMVIPGVSGSMVLLLLGYYNPILSSVSSCVTALVNKDMVTLGACLVVIIPFALGVACGIFGVAKLVEYIFRNFASYAYWAVLGLLVASPFVIFMMNHFPALTVFNTLTGLAALFVGIFVSMKLGE